MSHSQPVAETVEPKTVSSNGTMSADPGSASAPAPPRRSRRRIGLAVGVVVAVAVLIFGDRYIPYAKAHESTDRAFIDRHIVGMSPNVANNRSRRYGHRYQHVKA